MTVQNGRLDSIPGSEFCFDLGREQGSTLTLHLVSPAMGVALIGRIAREDNPAHLSLADIGACLLGRGEPSTLITC